MLEQEPTPALSQTPLSASAKPVIDASLMLLGNLNIYTTLTESGNDHTITRKKTSFQLF